MRLDPFDAVLDARSESRYEDDPQAEPDTREVLERGYEEKCAYIEAYIVDESAGFRG
jgi:hypothetical protein